MIGLSQMILSQALLQAPIVPVAASRKALAAAYEVFVGQRTAARARGDQRIATYPAEDEPVYLDVSSFRRLAGEDSSRNSGWDTLGTSLRSLVGTVTAAPPTCSKESAARATKAGCPWIAATSAAKVGERLVIRITLGWVIGHVKDKGIVLISEYEVELAPNGNDFRVVQAKYKGASTATLGGSPHD